jgi:hypothetical protein
MRKPQKIVLCRKLFSRQSPDKAAKSSKMRREGGVSDAFQIKSLPFSVAICTNSKIYLAELKIFQFQKTKTYISQEKSFDNTSKSCAAGRQRAGAIHMLAIQFGSHSVRRCANTKMNLPKVEIFPSRKAKDIQSLDNAARICQVER